MKLAALCFEDDPHKALKMKSAEISTPVSELVNEAARSALLEDAEDLEVFKERAAQPTMDFQTFVSPLKKMENFRITIKRSAGKEIEKLPLKDRKRIMERIRSLASGPRPHGGKKLSGLEKYRIRQGNYRILQQIGDGEPSSVIVKAGQLGDVC